MNYNIWFHSAYGTKFLPISDPVFNIRAQWTLGNLNSLCILQSVEDCISDYKNSVNMNKSLLLKCFYYV